MLANSADKTLLSRLGQAISFLAAMLLLSAGAFAQTISLRADEWYPYNGTPDSNKPGYMVEIARQIFSEAGYEIDYQLTPWSRAVKDLQAGSIDGIIGASRQDAPFALFPNEALGLPVEGIFTLATSQWKFSGMDSLSSICLGVIADYSYQTKLNNYIAAHRNHPTLLQITGGEAALEQNINKLKLGRISALVSEPAVFAHSLQKLKLPAAEFRLAGELEDLEAVYIAFAPARPDAQKYADLLDNGIKRMRANGRLKTILQRYHLSDWQTPVKRPPAALD